MKSKVKAVCLFLCVVLSPIFSQEYDPVISELINTIQIDSVEKYVSELSGEIPVKVDGKMEIIKNRYARAKGNKIAASYLKNKLSSFGLNTEYHNYSRRGYNVIATQFGTINPEKIFIVCAHYDSKPSRGKAPGADDNASGTSSVLEIARVLSKQKIKNTIVYALWDEEEIGLVGSKAYAKEQAENDVDIIGVLNLDMIGIDDDDIVKIYSNKKSSWIVEELNNINSNYKIGLEFEVDSRGKFRSSDHYSFWRKGYEGVLMIENSWRYNDYYHTKNDLLSNLDLNYLIKNVKVSFGLIAYWSDILTDVTKTNQVDERKQSEIEMKD